jgi:tRNA-specific 2-thiouridylase
MSAGQELTMVAMSGGVDSAVAAALLAKAGRPAVGVSLRLHDASHEGGAGRCCSPEDFRDARMVAGKIGIPFYVLDYESEFRKAVLSRFMEEYRQGRTPSPCVACNSEVKFGALMNHAGEVGASRIATGHYARLGRRPDGTITLRVAADRSKDQSYFLFDLRQEQLARAEFPVGELTKAQVREVARELGLAVAEKPESQDICFVPGGDYRAVLHEEGGGLGKTGRFVDAAGTELGRHDGIAGYTVGQRRGLGISGDSRLYVLNVDARSGDVLLGPDSDLLAKGLVASRWNWISGAAPAGPVTGTLRIRYRHAGAAARIENLGEGLVRAAFEKPQRAVTPGQAAVLYDGDEVLGGGWIERRIE